MIISPPLVARVLEDGFAETAADAKNFTDMLCLVTATSLAQPLGTSNQSDPSFV